MRQTAIFSGSSHPHLVDKICGWLGESPSKVALGKFKNGETSVEIREFVLALYFTRGRGGPCYEESEKKKTLRTRKKDDYQGEKEKE